MNWFGTAVLSISVLFNRDYHLVHTHASLVFLKFLYANSLLTAVNILETEME